MPRAGKLRPGAIGLAFTMWDIWRRLPPKQRQQMLAMARKHGPVAASKLISAGRSRATRRR
jgi:hypothetical protein